MQKSKYPKWSAALSIGMAIAVFFLILTMSIGLPIYFRPFYYWHIGPFDIEAETGMSREAIIAGYNEMMNFCTMYTPFGAGEFAWSESGMQHFADVRKLFTLNLVVMLVAAAYVITVAVLAKRGIVNMRRLARRAPWFYGAVAAIVLPLFIGALAATDFDRAFTVFHTIFFPGKDNWLFDWRTDEIILALPEEFFRNCAILIGSSIVIASGAIIVTDCVRGRSRTATVCAAESEETDENTGDVCFRNDENSVCAVTETIAEQNKKQSVADRTDGEQNV